MAEWVEMAKSKGCRHHWMYNLNESNYTGVVWMRSTWHRLVASGKASICWVPCPEYNHLSLDEFKLVALALFRMGG